jgi:LCP family protein required for cell wall assembly
MGLDSRRDQQGRPLPQDILDALHAGDENTGSYDADVLIVIHMPAGNGPVTAISIPRDDYVELPGSPDGTSQGKIKQAYGLAFDQEHRRLLAQDVRDPVRLEQLSRDAGRNAEITTVSRFLGGVPIDHFIEVTMGAFYQLAQVVQPITVCVNEDTSDSYSGADFHRGRQQIDAAQALAFVRQRRDTADPDLEFTDLDRERRQQAFIASLAYQLRQAGTLTDPARLSALIDVVEPNIAVDPGLDLLALASHAPSLTSGDITFVTLPVDHFGYDDIGEYVNFVDLAKVRAMTHDLLTPAPAPAAAAASGMSMPGDLRPGDPQPDGAPQDASGSTIADAISGGGIPCVK